MNFVILSYYILKNTAPAAFAAGAVSAKLWLKDRGFYQARSLPNFSL